MNLVNSTPERATSLSRSASRASGRSRTSSLSKSQSLIKKNIELQDLKPADVLIERFVAWKAIVKQLTAYFEGIADIENNTARELTKLAGVIQVPFRAGNQFLGEGGLQDIYYDIRNKTRIVADQHADLGRTIDSSIVQHLQKLRIEIKAHVKNVQNDTGKLAAGVARERELSTKLVGELANAISTFKNTPMVLQPRNDPFVANQAVSRQLSRQVVEENLLHKSIVMMQQNSAHFEEGIVKSIQSAWQTFDEWQARASAATQNVYRGLAEHMATLAPDREWIQFAARSDHLLHPDTPLRDPEFIKYPLKDDPSVVPVHTGHLERKKRFTRNYVESYFVLTPAGFLHEYATSDSGSGKQSLIPTFSLFLPNCTLGPASSPRSTAHKFHIEGRKDGLGTTKSGSFKGMLGGDANKAWNFRARSHDDMMEWWNDIRMLCARYLVASEQVDRTGPVEDAVRSVGYDSEAFEEEFSDEEEEEELEALEVHGAPEDRAVGAGEAPPPVRMSSMGATGVGITGDDGSSVEEELENEHPYEEPPVYSHPTGEKYAAGVEIGPHGYALDKKSIPGAYPPPINSASRGEDGIAFHNQPVNAKYHAAPNLVHNHSYAEVRSQRAIVDGEQGPITPREEDQPHVDTGEQKLGRRLSQRQLEKSPEHDVAGVGHVPTQRHVNLGQGLPPPIQLHDPGVVAGAPHPKRQDSASRHRSPPPRVYLSDEEEDETREMARKVEGAQEEDEDMYVKNDSEPRLRASDDHYVKHRSLSPSPVPVAGANTSSSATSENGNAVKSSYPTPIMRNGQATTATSKSPTPSHRVESERSSIPEVDVGGPSAGVVGSEEGGIPTKNKKLKKQRGKKSMVDSISEAVGIKASENGEA